MQLVKSRAISALAVLALAVLTACGGSSVDTPRLPQPGSGGSGGGQPVIADAPGGSLAAQLVRQASGEPSGVRLFWTALDDSSVTGYHLYKDTNAVPDTARGDDSYWLPVLLNATSGEYDYDKTGASLIPQPAGGGQLVVNDLFPVSIGDTFQYRLASVDSDGDESRLSAELNVTISSFNVIELLTLATGVGDAVEINGERFGIHDPANDRVLVPGSVWQDGTGFVAQQLEATVTGWTQGTITIEVPQGATEGPISVEIGGVQQATPERLPTPTPTSRT